MRNTLPRLLLGSSLILASVAAPALAAAESADATTAGRVAFRARAGLDLNKTINLGGDNTGTQLGGNADLGFGYFVINNLSVDLDVSTRFTFLPATAVTAFGLTPGAHYFPLPRTYVRAGVPISFLPSFNLGVLAGLGYSQPLADRIFLLVGIDYTYWLQGPLRSVAPQGQIDLRAGIQTSF